MEFIRELMEAISDDALEDRFVKAALDYGYGKAPRSFGLLTNQMINRFPEWTYEGKMYRAIAIPSRVALEASSPSDVWDYIASKSDPDQVTSWSSQLKGAIRYHNLVATKNAREDRVFVILEQNGKGFDYRPWFKSYFVNRQKDPQMLAYNVQVYEVLSRINSSARLGIFFVNGEGTGYKSFSPDRFKQLQQAIQGKDVVSDINSRPSYNRDLARLSKDPKKSKVGVDMYDSDLYDHLFVDDTRKL